MEEKETLSVSQEDAPQKKKKSFSDRTTIPLELPVEHNGITYDSLTIRRARARDHIVAAKPGGTQEEKEVRLLSNLCEVPPDVIGLLDFGDYQRVQGALLGFLS